MNDEEPEGNSNRFGQGPRHAAVRPRQTKRERRTDNR